MNMPEPEILYEKRESLAVVTFNRPDALNAFRRAMIEQLLAILDDVMGDEATRVLVLTGRGRAFSAGVDLGEFDQLLGGAAHLAEARAQVQRLQELTRRMLRLPKPILAAVNGVAVGVGAELAIASDIRLAAEGASFAFAEVRRGLFETNGVLYLLPRLVGAGRALEMMLTGERITASAALQAGLVTRVVADEGLMAAAFELAGLLASNAPISSRLIKQGLQRTYDLDLEGVMQLEEDGMLTCLTSEDLQEGVRAFLEKRPPVYRGR